MSIALLQGPIQGQVHDNLSSSILQGKVQAYPIIAIDFSLANLTFDDNSCMHSTKTDKKNDYRDIIKLICKNYKGVLSIPMFGYAAKTTKDSPDPADFFPLSMQLKNPFVSNVEAYLDEVYSECLKSIELATPIKLAKFFAFIKSLS